MERPSAEAPRRRRWGPPVADLPSATTPPAHAAPGCASWTGRESTDGARLADPRTATSRDGCASTRDGPATTSTPQSSGRPADEPPESTTASREKRRRRSRWDAPGDGIVAVARGPSDRPEAVAVVPTRGRDTGALFFSRPRRDEGTNEREGQSHTSETGLLDESFKSFKSDTMLPPAGVLTLPGGVVAKLPASFLCERDAPTNADAATKTLFAKLARVNRAEIFGGESRLDEGVFEEALDSVKDLLERHETERKRKRSVSPEPVYGPDGARVNTREKREVEKLAAARAECMRLIKKLCPSFAFPESYAPPPVTRKIFIPVAKHPGYNFFGLIIGPRGNTQKQMQRDFGVRIVIRGRGSEKKASLGATETSRVAGRHDPTEEPMHVLVTGDDEASVDAAAAAVGRLLEPLRDEENEHKRAQLRELAVLNGTLRERHDDGVKPGSADDDCVGVGPGSALPPELRARVAAQYEKDARATQKLADDGDGGDHDAAYRAFLAEVGVAPRAREGEKNAGGETRDDETLDDASAVDKRKAYVGRLPPFAAEHTVRLTFQPFGAIEKVEVVPDREKNLPCRGFAFVQFREEAAARAAATYFSTRAAAFPHPPPPGFKREPFRAMDVRVKADPRPQTAAVRVAQTTPVTSHDPRCRLYVAKLPHTFSSAELRSLVAASLAGSTAGSTAEVEDGDKSSGEESIVSCDVVVDKITGLSRGFAFVRMRDARVAARVVAALDGVHVENRGLVVRVAAEKNRRTPTSDPSRPPSSYPTGGGFVTPLSGDPYVNAGVYDPHGNPFVYYDPRAVAAAEAAVAAANPALAAAAAAEMAAIATGAGPGPGPAAPLFFSGAHGHMSPGIFPAAAATIAPGDPVEAPPPPPP